MEILEENYIEEKKNEKNKGTEEDVARTMLRMIHGIRTTNGGLEKIIQGFFQVWKVVNNRNNGRTTNTHKKG